MRSWPRGNSFVGLSRKALYMRKQNMMPGDPAAVRWPGGGAACFLDGIWMCPSRPVCSTQDFLECIKKKSIPLCLNHCSTVFCYLPSDINLTDILCFMLNWISDSGGWVLEVLAWEYCQQQYRVVNSTVILQSYGMWNIASFSSWWRSGCLEPIWIK